MATFPTTNLQPGQQGEPVKQLQQYLVEEGYMTQAEMDTGPGIYGPKTKAAVARLQANLGVDPQGNPGYWGPITRRALDEAFVSSPAMRAESETRNQALETLRQEGYYSPSEGEIQSMINDLKPTPSNNAPEDTSSGSSPEDMLLQQVIEQLKANLAQAQKNGQILNPAIEITPEKTAEFLAKAEGEINPYYGGQLKLARETLFKSLGYAVDDINRLEESYAKKYKTSYRNLSEQMAEKGLAYSGTRKLGEEELASTFGESLSDARRTVQRTAEQQAGQFAQQWGSRDLPSEFNIPLTSFDIGQPTTRRSQLPLYTLSPDVYKDITGEQEFGRQTAVKTRASELESAFRTQEEINKMRQLL